MNIKVVANSNRWLSEIDIYNSIDRRLIARRRDRCRFCGRRKIRRILPKVRIIKHNGISHHVRRLCYCGSCHTVLLFLDRFEGDTRKGFIVKQTKNQVQIQEP